MEIISGKRNTDTPALLSDVSMAFISDKKKLCNTIHIPYVHEMGIICFYHFLGLGILESRNDQRPSRSSSGPTGA